MMFKKSVLAVLFVLLTPMMLHADVAENSAGVVEFVDIPERQLLISSVLYRVASDVEVNLLYSKNTAWSMLAADMLVEVEYSVDSEGRRVLTKVEQRAFSAAAAQQP